jgi:mannan endo-1,4-beta-mannosidase
MSIIRYISSTVSRSAGRRHTALGICLLSAAAVPLLDSEPAAAHSGPDRASREHGRNLHESRGTSFGRHRGHPHAASHHGSHRPRRPHKRDFVQQSGGELRLDGDRFRFAGSNNYYLGYKSQYMVNDVLEQAAAEDFSVMRTWGFVDIGNADGSSSVSGKADGRVYYQYWNGTAPAYNDGADGLKQLDYVIYRAGQLGIKLVIPLTNNWADFGGMDQYVRWRGGLYHDQFYTDPVIGGWYKAWIHHVMSRVNSYTGVAYANDPTIMAWELANEPRCGGSGVYPRSAECNTQTLLSWADDVSRFIRKEDKRHLISVGDEGFYCVAGATDWTENCGEGVDTLALARLPKVDIASFHLYPDGWGKTAAWGKEWIERHIRDGRRIDRAPILGEFGWRDASTRNPTYKAWTDAVLGERGAGALYWMLAARQDDGSLYPDYDGFTVYAGSPVFEAFGNFGEMMDENRSLYFPPVADHDSATTFADVPVELAVTLNDVSYKGYALDLGSIDLDPATPGVQAFIDVPQGRFEASATGSVAFIPTPGVLGEASAAYVISDERGRVSNEAVLDVTVEPNPDASIVVASFESGTEGWGTTWDAGAGTVSTSTDFHSDGAQSLRIDSIYGHWFGATYGTPLDLGSKTTLSWDIQASTGTSQQLALQTGSGWDWCEGATWMWANGGETSHFEVDLTTLSCGAAANLAQINALYIFTGAAGGTYFIDNVRAE